MYLSTLQVRNFRNYESEIFKFNSKTNAIIGENDSGKTNALTALRILLDDSYYYSNKTLKESDFYSGISNGWRGEWIIISATFEEMDTETLDNEILASISLNSGEVESDIENQNNFSRLTSNTSKNAGSISLFIRPDKNVRKKLFDAVNNGDSKLFKEIRSSISLTDYEFYYTSKSNLNFCNDEEYFKLVGNLSNCSPSNPDDDDEAFLGTKINMSDVFKHISVVYVDALRDVLREMKKGQNPVKRIVDTIGSDISIEDLNDLQTIIQDLNGKITNVHEIKKIGDELNQQLRDIVGSVYSPSLLLSSNISDDMSSLSKFLLMKPEQNMDLDLLGLGHLNMIYLALKIVEFKTCRSRELLNIMLIEEPEAHIHHHIQKTLFEGLGLQKSYTQILMSTHSVHLAEVSEISHMNVLKSSNGKTIVMNPANNLNTFANQKLKKKNLDLVKAVERYLDVKRNGLLFSKGVVLVEGDAEEILIPQMVKQAFGVSLDELGIGLINIGSTSFEYIASLFSDDRIQRKCAIITDLDKQVVHGNSNPYKDKAEELGNSRKEKFCNLFGENQWVDTFYACSTFELEFLDENKDNILTYINQIIEDSFTKDLTKDAYKKELMCSEPSTRNSAMLRLANHIGKGWFAIEISDKLDSNINIPSYIVDAIAFACQETVDIAIYKKILLHTFEISDKNDETMPSKLKTNDTEDLQNGIKYILANKDGMNEKINFVEDLENYAHILDMGASR